MGAGVFSGTVWNDDLLCGTRVQKPGLESCPGAGLAPGDLNDYKIKFPLGDMVLHSSLQIRT